MVIKQIVVRTLVKLTAAATKMKIWWDNPNHTRTRAILADVFQSTSLQPSQPASASSYPADNQPPSCLAPITDITPNNGCVRVSYTTAD